MLSYPAGGGGGYPIPDWECTPSWVPPHPDLSGGGTPSLDREYHPGLRYPQKGNWDQSLGYPPPPERTWDQWKYYGMEKGYPPGCEQTENITFPILRMRAVIKRMLVLFKEGGACTRNALQGSTTKVSDLPIIGTGFACGIPEAESEPWLKPN